MKKRNQPTPFELAYAEHLALEDEIKQAREVLRFSRAVRDLQSQVSTDSGIRAIGPCHSAAASSFN